MLATERSHVGRKKRMSGHEKIEDMNSHETFVGSCKIFMCIYSNILGYFVAQSGSENMRSSEIFIVTYSH